MARTENSDARSGPLQSVGIADKIEQETTELRFIDDRKSGNTHASLYG